MVGVQLNAKVIKTGIRFIQNLVTAQNTARTRLLMDLNAVCRKCDDAYSSLNARLKPIRAVFRDSRKLAVELRSLAADASAREKFKPEQLCSEIDQLLLDLASNVQALKYSVDFLSIEEIRSTLQSLGNYDQALCHQYDTFMREMSSIADAIDAGNLSQRERLAAHAAAAIRELQDELQRALRDIRKARAAIVSLA